MHSCSHSGNTGIHFFLSASGYTQFCGYLYQIRNSTGFCNVYFGQKKVNIRGFVILQDVSGMSFPRIHTRNNNRLFL